MAIIKKCFITDTNMLLLCKLFEITSHFDKFNEYSYCTLDDLTIYYMAKMIIELSPDIEENDSEIAEIMNIINDYITVHYKLYNM